MDNFNHNELSREEILSLLMDGELQDANEQSLFAELAKETDLQAQLKDTLAIREAIKSDSEAFAPPPDLTAELFDKLGYAQRPKIAPLGFDWSRFMRRVAAPLMLMMLAITLPLIYNATTDTNTIDASVPVISSESIEQEHTNVVEANSVSTTENLQSRSANAALATSSNQRILTGNQDADEFADNDVYDVVSTESEPEDFAQSNFLDSKIITNSNMYSDVILVADNSEMQNFAISDIKAIRHTRQDREWTLHLRGIYNLNADNEAMQEFNPTKSFAAGIMMKLSEDVSFGLEGGREVYSFSNTIEGLQDDPYVFWYALSFRYLVNELNFSGITPYVRVNGGGSSRGPVFAAFIGGEYRLSDTYALTLGYGANLLTYKSNNLQYATSKTGLNFGINFRF